MADNPNQFDEEYQFTDLDETGTGFEQSQFNETDFKEDEAGSSSLKSKLTEGNLKRNIMIGAGFVIVILVAYKFMGAFFSTKKTVSTPSTTHTSQASQPKPTVPAMTQQPIRQQTFTPVVTHSQADPQIKQKLSALEINVKSGRSEMNAININVESLKTSLSDLMSKINDLNKNIANLTEQVQYQQDQIAKLKQRPKKRVRRTKSKPKVSVKYYIQAIIPGRAWLMSTNGTTITVSEGTKVPGFGRVKLIDPHQGKVIMSSGKDILFSPSDT